MTVRSSVRLLPRLDHERPVEAATDLLRRDLVRVVPERPELVGAKAVDVALTRHDGVLRHSGDAVFRVRHVHAVPVDRDAFVDVLVDQGRLDKVALADADLRAGNLAVEGPRFGSPAAAELHIGLLGDQGDPVVRFAGPRPMESLDADRPMSRVVVCGPSAIVR
jgi:hypothetical protein